MQNKKDQRFRDKSTEKMTTLGGVEVVIKRFHFMIQKGAYLYENMDGWEKFEQPRLSAKNGFYSKLNMKGISDHDHNHAQHVWNIPLITGEIKDLMAWWVGNYIVCKRLALINGIF